MPRLLRDRQRALEQRLGLRIAALGATAFVEVGDGLVMFERKNVSNARETAAAFLQVANAGGSCPASRSSRMVRGLPVAAIAASHQSSSLSAMSGFLSHNGATSVW